MEMLYLHDTHRFDAAIKAAVPENGLSSGSAGFLGYNLFIF